MDLTTLREALSVLEGNVAALVSELEKVREENTVLKIKIARQEETIKDFQNNGKITKIVGSIGPTGDDADKLRLRIDENIQLIDKCIAQLSRNETDL